MTVAAHPSPPSPPLGAGKQAAVPRERSISARHRPPARAQASPPRGPEGLFSVTFPCHLTTLDGATFHRSREGRSGAVDVTFKAPSAVRGIEANCFAMCLLNSICIPSSVEFLGDSCFVHSTIRSLNFEPQSRLMGIGDSCFQSCSSTSICIPASVEVLGKSCFAGEMTRGRSSIQRSKH